MSDQPPITHPGRERLTSTHLVRKDMPNDVHCYWCERVNSEDNNLQRRLTVGEWNGKPICEEHVTVFVEESGPWTPA